MLNFALIGAGQMAKNFINTLESIPNAKISIVCAKSNSNLKKLPSKLKKTTKLEDVLSENKIDGVIIATPASTHFKLLSIFLKQNSHILVEKPFVTTYKEALILKKIRTKSKVMVGHTLLFHPAYLEIKKLVNNKKIISLYFEGQNNKIRKDTTLLWDWGSHPISLFIDLLGGNPKSAQALSFKNKNEYELELLFSNNTKGLFKIGWKNPKKIKKLEIITENQKIIFDDMKYPNLEIGKIEGFSLSYPKVEKTLPLTNEVNAFINLVQRKKSIGTNIDFGVSVTKVLEACQKSILSRGKLVKV